MARWLVDSIDIHHSCFHFCRNKYSAFQRISWLICAVCSSHTSVVTFVPALSRRIWPGFDSLPYFLSIHSKYALNKKKLWFEGWILISSDPREDQRKRKNATKNLVAQKPTYTRAKPPHVINHNMLIFKINQKMQCVHMCHHAHTHMICCLSYDLYLNSPQSALWFWRQSAGLSCILFSVGIKCLISNYPLIINVKLSNNVGVKAEKLWTWLNQENIGQEGPHSSLSPFVAQNAFEVQYCLYILYFAFHLCL